MPLTYDFTFSPDYAGLSATVIDSSGAEVEGSPATLDAAGQCSLSLAEGIYLAGASNTATAKNNAHTNGVLNVPASIEAGGGGGGGVSDGVGAVIFGGSGISIPINNTTVHCTLAPEDDPPRAPLREDLVILDPEDNTTLNVVKSGLYDISLNAPLGFAAIALSDTGVGTVRAEVKFEVNGENEPPAYDYNNRVWWSFGPAALADAPPASQAANITLPQILLAGDTVQVGFRAVNEGQVDVTGSLTLQPDITMVMTWRGDPPAGLE